MTAPTALPGLAVDVLRPQAAPSPLRTDVVGVIGRTRRGTFGVPVRVQGLRDLESRLGGPDPRFATGYALRAYFDNGGQVAHVLRVGDGETAHGDWDLGDVAGAGFPQPRFRVVATSPGGWANAGRVTIGYRVAGPARGPEVSARIEVPGEPPEFLTASPGDVVERFALSRFVRLLPPDPAPGPLPRPAGPSVASWTVTLDGGTDVPPRPEEYLAAVRRLGDVVEVALVLAPDVHTDLGQGAGAVLRALLGDAAERQDRLVLVDVPPDAADPPAAVAWTADLAARTERAWHRAGAVYHPWVRVTDPFGLPGAPLRAVPPSGHVAGLASRLDRERGAQHTPANALLAGALDLATPLPREQQAALVAGGLNIVRCRPGRGLEVWGGRTLDADAARRFVAHRRLLHRLVRAIRRVAEPLAFEPQGPVLRFTLVRSLSSVLLAAWRAGGLQGSTPDEGFRVRCDEGNNPPELEAEGRLECEVLLAPAVPMEFVRILLTLAPQGVLEVVEA